MSEPFVAEIRMFCGNFAPRGWAFCEGQLLPIAQNQALFALVGTMYGGDGRVTFGLPDLRGRVPVHAGIGVGLTERVQGTAVGEAAVTLTTDQLPSHTHAVRGVAAPATRRSPLGALPAIAAEATTAPGPADTTLDPQAVLAVGGGQPHVNLQPYLTVSFIIALEGIFPARG